jgi:shikimate dehydrogenase
MTGGIPLVAGVVGHPISHSLSPLIHNAWLEHAGIAAAYGAFDPGASGFADFVLDHRAGLLKGVNVTIPFKAEALALADSASARAQAAGAANLLVFRPSGEVFADNTDGLGLLAAFARQAPGFDITAGPVALLGAGGAARGAAAALLEAGVGDLRIANRTLARAEVLAEAFGPRVRAFGLHDPRVVEGVGAVINATAAGLVGRGELVTPLDRAPAEAVFMDMVYKPLLTAFLRAAGGRRTVDGLEMLIGQARPSFEALFDRPPPPEPDIRALALAALEVA